MPAAPVTAPPITAVHAPPPAPAPVPEPVPDLASITLRLPDVQGTPGETIGLSVDPGQRTYLVALVRNNSGIVDNFTLRVDGIPDDWYSVMPNPVYLVPYGTAGAYEQEVQIHLHPPRAPEAEAKVWHLNVIADSAAQAQRAAVAPFVLGIQPYEEFEPKLKPEKVSGRRSADFEVMVRNKANAPVGVALGISDAEDLLEADFDGPRRIEVPAGETTTSKMTVRPPKQIWIGRPVEHRFEVLTKTGEAADELLAEEEALYDEDEDLYESDEDGDEEESRGRAAAKKAGKRYKPRVAGPRVQVGPGGVRATGPRMSGAKPRAPRVPSKSFDLKSLKKAGGGAPAPQMFTGPLLPTQAVFRQKPWIPRWAAILFLLLLLAAVLLFLLIPRTVAVPDLKGQKVFDATKALTEAQLTLDPVIKEQVAPNLPPGTVIDQTPAPGEKVKKESQVHVVTAIGTGNKSVPDVVGKTLTEANSIIEKKGLVVGPVVPQPPDPEGKVKSQIPLAGEVAKEGKPIQLFLETETDKAKKAGGAGGGEAGGGGGGGGGGEKIVIPAIGEDPLDAYAQKIAELQLTPIKQVSFSDTAEAGTLFGTDPPGGTEVEAGTEVKLLVSAGFPQIAYDNGKDVLLVNGADGKKLETIAKSPRVEKEPAFNMSGGALAFVSAANPPPGEVDSPDGIIQLANRQKPDQAPVSLTPQGEKWRVPAFAPTADANILAAIKFGGDKKVDGDVCLGAVSREGFAPKCLDDGGLEIKRVLRWAPNGKAIFAFGVEKLGTFGMVRFTTKKAFSPDAADWSKGKFVTDISTPGKGVLDMSISPDGKRMAAVANFGASAAGFTLSFTDPGDFLLGGARTTQVEACKLAWRPDSLEVAAVQADDCEDGVGDIARVDVRSLKSTTLKAGADSPAYQPVLPEEAG